MDFLLNSGILTVAAKQMEGIVGGEKYTCLGKEAHCVDCGSEIYVDGIQDYNLKALHDQYREKNTKS